MNQVTKDEILKQVGAVLQFCQEIVSRLSSPQCCEQNTSEYVSMSSMSDIMTKTFSSDCSESSAPLHRWPTFHNITEVDDTEEYNATDVADKYNDPEKAEENYYDAEKAEETHYDTEKVDQFIYDKEKVDQFINNTENPNADEVREDLLLMISVAAPNAIYDPNWREKVVRTLIDPQLLFAWDNAITIFNDDDPDYDDATQYQPPVITYHTIDIFNVNKRFIENIPKPNRYPVLGVSNDPNFYHEWYQTGDPYKKSQKFLNPFPFGSEYGYETNVGIVPPPTDPIHGYIWSEQYGGGFVLHAVKPGDSPRTNPRRRA